MSQSKKSTTLKNKHRIKKNVRLDALDPKMNPKVRREYNDADYLRKLPPDIYKWYAQFIDEYLNSSIKKDKLGRVINGHIHRSSDMAKRCSDANNYRNNDLFSVGKANNFVHEIDSLIDNRDGWYITDYNLTEDAIISQIDSEDQYEELTFKEYVQIRANMIEPRRLELDDKFCMVPYSFLYYYVYDTAGLNEYQLDKVLADPSLLEKLIKNPKFFKRKKYRTTRSKNRNN